MRRIEVGDLPCSPNQAGRLFNPDADPLSNNHSTSTSMVAMISGSHHLGPLTSVMMINNTSLREPTTEAMSDVSSTDVAPGGYNLNTNTSPRRPLPSRGMRGGATPQRSPQMANTSARGGGDPQQQPQKQMPATRRLFEPSRDDPLRFSSSGRPAPPSSYPQHQQHSINNGYISASTSDTRSLASSAFTLSSATSGTSVDSGLFNSPPQSLNLNGNPILERDGLGKRV